jgi:dTDP-4-amino-4,6-dideoxygalactose transaminase
MGVPFLDLKAHLDQVGEEIRRELDEIIETTGFVLGPKVEAFEEKMAELAGTRHCVGVSSGTAAVHCICAAAGLPAGSGVVVPPNTFTATVEGIMLAGHVPVFADVEPGSWTLDPKRVRQAAEDWRGPDGVVDPRSGAKIAAVMSVDLYGQPADNAALEQIAEENGWVLLEDACQAHGGSLAGRPAGSFGLAAAFSFYPGKNLGAFGEAGAVTTDSDEVADRVRMLRDHGSDRKYYYSMIGHNYRMSAFQGAVLGVKIDHIHDWNDARREAAARYDRMLDGLPLELPRQRDGARHVYHLYPVHLDERDRLREFLGDRGIASGLHYPLPLHVQEAYAHLGYAEGDFPVSERNSSRNLTLPIFPEITEDQQREVADAVGEFLGGADAGL